jgi:hypothetical protein
MRSMTVRQSLPLHCDLQDQSNDRVRALLGLEVASHPGAGRPQQTSFLHAATFVYRSARILVRERILCGHGRYPPEKMKHKCLIHTKYLDPYILTRMKLSAPLTNNDVAGNHGLVCRQISFDRRESTIRPTRELLDAKAFTRRTTVVMDSASSAFCGRAHGPQCCKTK